MSAAPVLVDRQKFILEVLKGPHAGLTVESDQSVVTIGRGTENLLVLINDPRVSRQHIEIRQVAGEFQFQNLSQKNFVLLNGQNANSEKLNTKSVIQVGDSEIRFTIVSPQNALQAVPSFGEKTSVPVANLAQVPVPPAAPSLVAIPRTSAVPGATYQGPAHQQQGTNHQGSSQQGALGARPQARRAPVQTESNKMIYILIGVILIVLFFMMGGKGKSKINDNKAFRSAAELDLARQQSDDLNQEFQLKREKMNQVLFQKANENFLRGYRDYRQGQYLRAKEAFQLVLNLDPDNDLARRYLNLAKIRFDEVVKYNMLQGRKYRAKQNYRMCKAHFQTVMTLLGTDPTNSEYKEARQLQRECSLALETRY